MKYLLYLLFSIIPFFCFSQDINIGTITVDINNTATLKFDSPIEWVVIGNNPQIAENKWKYYDIFQDKNLVLIRGNDSSSPLTSITITLSNGDVFFGFLAFGKTNKIFYDFVPEKPILKDNPDLVTSEPYLDNRILQLLSSQPKYRTYGIKEAGVEFLISDIRNDDKYTYLKLEINNSTSTDYIIDGLLFKYVQGKRKGLKKKEAAYEERLMPRKIEGPDFISAYSKDKIAIAIPLFSVNNKGVLLINIREKKGTRNVEIILNGKDLLSCDIF